MTSGYDPARSRPGPSGEAAVDAVFARTVEPNGAARSPSDAPLRRPEGPTVMPDPAPSDEILVLVGAVGALIVAVAGYVVYRRLRQRR